MRLCFGERVGSSPATDGSKRSLDEQSDIKGSGRGRWVLM
jgi:hypothetical protein